MTQVLAMSNGRPECIRGLTEYIADGDILAEVEEVLKVHGY